VSHMHACQKLLHAPPLMHLVRLGVTAAALQQATASRCCAHDEVHAVQRSGLLGPELFCCWRCSQQKLLV
jgi:hypothetical protein